MIEIEGDGGCDRDGREEGMGASVVSGGDAPPVLKFGEEVLDFVALASLRQRIQDQPRTFVVAHLPFGQQTKLIDPEPRYSGVLTWEGWVLDCAF